MLTREIAEGKMVMVVAVGVKEEIRKGRKRERKDKKKIFVEEEEKI